MNCVGGADGREYARRKGLTPILAEVGIGDRDNMIFSSTAATYGRGRAIVVAEKQVTDWTITFEP